MWRKTSEKAKQIQQRKSHYVSSCKMLPSISSYWWTTLYLVTQSLHRMSDCHPAGQSIHITHCRNFISISFPDPQSALSKVIYIELPGIIIFLWYNSQKLAKIIWSFNKNLLFYIHYLFCLDTLLQVIFITRSQLHLDTYRDHIYSLHLMKTRVASIPISNSSIWYKPRPGHSPRLEPK